MIKNKFLFTIGLSLILFFAFSFSSMAQESAGMNFKDMPDNWSTKALQNAVNNGLLLGSDGMIKPNEKLTRSQMAALIVRAFGAADQGDLSVFTDVSKTKWYYAEMSKAYRMGIVNGYAGRLNPDSLITRQEACVIIARAFKLEPAKSADKPFSDAAAVADWAKGDVYGAVNSGYMQGYNGKLDPKGYITRAQFAQILDNCIAQYINKPGEYTAVSEGSIMINAPGVTLKNLTVQGDLIIGDGVGDGDVTMDNVKVTGKVVARGGGVNSIKIIGNSNINEIVIARVNGEIRVFVDGAVVDTIQTDGGDDVIIEGNVGKLIMTADDIKVTVKNAEIASVQIEGSGTSITASAGSSIKAVVVNGVGAVIEGAGKVESVQANANNITVNTAGTAVTARQGTTGVVAGTKPVSAGDSVVTGASSNTGSSNSSGSSGSVTAPTIIGITSGAAVTGAAPTWTDASGTTSSAKLNDENYSKGTPITDPGAYTLTVTASNASGQTASTTVSFTIYEPDGTAELPFPVLTAGDLNAIRGGGDPGHAGWDLSDSYIQFADIDLSGYSTGSGWDPVGDGANPFYGSFNGNGYIIKNLYIYRTSEYNNGLFGDINGASIEKVTVINADVAGGYYTGGIAGYVENGSTISACSVSGDIMAEGDAGGIAGGFNESTISNCYAAGNVSAWDGYAGGLVGYQDAGTIEYSYAAANVSSNDCVGGLVGYNYGTVAGSNYVLGGSVICSNENFSYGGYTSFGRIAGHNYGSCAGTVVPGLKFYVNPIDADGQSFSGTTGVNGTDAAGTISYTGWDFTSIWKNGSGGKPVFAWQTADAPDVPLIRGVGDRGTFYTVAPSWTTEAGVTYTAAVSSGGIEAAYISGSTIDTDGTYLLTVTATKASNGLKSTASVEFIINHTVPGMTISGVADGGIYNVALPIPNFDSPVRCEAMLSTDGGITYVTYNDGLLAEDGITDYIYKVTTIALTYPEASSQVSFTVNGAGTETKPFVIRSADDLLMSDNKWNGSVPWGSYGGSILSPMYYQLENDIDLTAIDFTPLGGSGAFCGVFDGGGHTISNLTINKPSDNKIGLFSSNKGTITNLTLTNVSVAGIEMIGGMVGQNQGTVSGCAISGTVSGEDRIGGLIGYNDASAEVINCSSSVDVNASGYQGGGLVGANLGLVQNCTASGSVTGNRDLGGLAGINGSDSVIIKSSATGSVISSTAGDSTWGKSIGGLVGDNNGSVTRSYATGPVVDQGNVGTSSYAGGLAGYNGNDATISNCYAVGNVTGRKTVGGISGYNSGAISRCYATGIVGGESAVGGVAGDNGSYGTIPSCFEKKDVTMNQATYAGVGWDFDTVWTINEGSGYPTLR